MQSLFHCFQHKTNDVPYNLIACKVGQNRRVPVQTLLTVSTCFPARIFQYVIIIARNVKLNAKSNTFILSPMDRDVEQILFLWGDFCLFWSCYHVLPLLSCLQNVLLFLFSLIILSSLVLFSSPTIIVTAFLILPDVLSLVVFTSCKINPKLLKIVKQRGVPIWQVPCSCVSLLSVISWVFKTHAVHKYHNETLYFILCSLFSHIAFLIRNVTNQ